MASGRITSWEIDGETVETVSDLIFLGSKITADGPGTTREATRIPFLRQDEACLSCPNTAGTVQSESETERKPEVPASPRDEALFHCAEASRVPRGPANYTASLTSQRHPGKFPRVSCRSRGKRGFPAATRERPRESFFNAS